ncbi:thioredoxin-disulfide reductase [Candidatus Woesearchaeota archaeon]|jgi:thioredoxin-disulfide reductase|nr:thioredoxin-disulfide reductase [Candidatus Woesearchaeota archaeon]
MKDVIIIGAGPAGLAAAIYTGRKRLSTSIISIDIGGQGNLTSHIENYPGALPQTGPELIEKFQTQAQKFGAEFVFGKAIKIEKTDNNFQVTMGDKSTHEAKSLILTFGKVPRQLGIPGEDEFFGKGVSTCATCDGPLYKDKIVAVVGGGNSALEAANDLSHFASKVYLIHRRQEFRADELTIEKTKNNPQVELVLDSVPIEINGDKFVNTVVTENKITKETREIKIDGLFLEIGSVVDTSIIKDLADINEHSEIIINERCETSCPGIFAAGDVTNTPFKQAIVAAGEGAKAALQTYTYLTGSKATLDWKK